MNSAFGKLCAEFFLATQVAPCFFFSRLTARSRDDVYMRVSKLYKTRWELRLTEKMLLYMLLKISRINLLHGAKRWRLGGGVNG